MKSCYHKVRQILKCDNVSFISLWTKINIMNPNRNLSSAFGGRAEIRTARGLVRRTSRVILILLLVMHVNCIWLTAQPPNWNNLKKCSKVEWEINDAQYEVTPYSLLEDRVDWGEQVIQVSDGGYVVAGFSQRPGGSYIAKFNANGNKVWCYRTTTDPGGAFIDVTETDDYYVAVGYAYNTASETVGTIF
jgi:hypothetical protein